jgi:hypothetical protein
MNDITGTQHKTALEAFDLWLTSALGGDIYK